MTSTCHRYSPNDSTARVCSGLIEKNRRSGWRSSAKRLMPMSVAPRNSAEAMRKTLRYAGACGSGGNGDGRPMKTISTTATAMTPDQVQLHQRARNLGSALPSETHAEAMAMSMPVANMSAHDGTSVM